MQQCLPVYLHPLLHLTLLLLRLLLRRLCALFVLPHLTAILLLLSFAILLFYIVLRDR